MSRDVIQIYRCRGKLALLTFFRNANVAKEYLKRRLQTAKCANIHIIIADAMERAETITFMLGRYQILLWNRLLVLKGQEKHNKNKNKTSEQYISIHIPAVLTMCRKLWHFLDLALIGTDLNYQASLLPGMYFCVWLFLMIWAYTVSHDNSKTIWQTVCICRKYRSSVSH